MAETSSLLNCRRGNSTASSNLVLSAKPRNGCDDSHNRFFVGNHHKVNRYIVPTLEKYLGDLTIDKEFDTLHGYAMQHIVSNAAAQYTINRNIILRYAGCKNRREQIEYLLTSQNPF